MLTGCSTIMSRIPFLTEKKQKVGGVYRINMDRERLVDLILVKKLTGAKRFYVFTKHGRFLEGYIRGSVVDYTDNPIEGVIVRVTDGRNDLPGFDPGISDSNGIYRIRFSLPVVKNVVDQAGTIAYNPPWEQQLDLLGAALEPQTKASKFRLYFDSKSGIVGIGEDLPKTITRKVTQEDQLFEAIPGSLPSANQNNSRSKRFQTRSPVSVGAGKKNPPPLPDVQEKKEPSKSGGKKRGYDFFGNFGEFSR